MKSTIAMTCGIAAIAGAAFGDVAYNNLGSGDSYSGNGYIIYGPQAPGGWTQGFQFVAQASGGITKLVVPIQSLSGDNGFSFEIFTEGGGMPGTSLGVVGQCAGYVSSGPPDPPPVEISSDGSIELSSGTTYWLVGKGSGTSQGTWHQNDQNVTGNRAWMAFGLPWQLDTLNLAAFRIEVQGEDCYANCDSSTSSPILNVNDFQCFLNRYAGGDSYANCDHSTSPPVLNVNDFQCFLNTYAAGCT